MASLIGRTLISKTPLLLSGFKSKSVPRLLTTIIGSGSGSCSRMYSSNLSPPQDDGLRAWYLEINKAPGDLLPPDPDDWISIPLRGETCSSATHWHIAMELPKPEADMNRDEIITYYINTLAKVLPGSKEEAKKKMFSVSTRHYYFFVCNVSSWISDRLSELPGVACVRPLSEADVKRADFARTGEPFVNGEVVPYDPKYHVGVLALMNGPATKPCKHPNYKAVDQNLAAASNRNRRLRREEDNRQL